MPKESLRRKMDIPILESVEDFKLLTAKEKKEHFAFIIKNVIPVENCKEIIEEIFNWSSTIPPQNPKEPYPTGVYNLHLQVKHNEPAPEEHINSELGTDFHERYTDVDVYNYRIGWIEDPKFVRSAPRFYDFGKKILNDYRLMTGFDFQHGPGGNKNLYFEFAQYPLGSGHIERHTHLRNIGNGQMWNYMTLLTQDGVDHSSASLKFEYNKRIFDTREVINQGDGILFRMDIPHFVDSVRSVEQKSVTPTSGRWTVGLFYY